MSTATVQPIETRYRGYRFRSRLEARWAVAFEELRIPWTYEAEGYRLPNGEWYLPDFEIRLDVGGIAMQMPFSVEVKGDLTNFTDWDRLWEYARFRSLLVLSDVPAPQPGWPSPLFPVLETTTVPVLGTEVAKRELWWLWFSGRGKADLAGGMRNSGLRIPPCTAAESAFYAARGARFEHGETP